MLTTVWGAIARHLLGTQGARVQRTSGPARNPLTTQRVFEIMLEHGDEISDEAIAALHEQEGGDPVSRQTTSRRRAEAIRQLRSADVGDFGDQGERARTYGLGVLTKPPGGAR